MILSGARRSSIFIGPSLLLAQIGFHQNEAAILAAIQDPQAAAGHVGEHQKVIAALLEQFHGIIHPQGRHLDAFAAHGRHLRFLDLLGHRTRDRVEILDGLKPGERVVAKNALLLLNALQTRAQGR